MGEASNLETEAARYGARLPDEIGLILLSVGEDGHIASLFPNSTVLNSEHWVVFVANALKPPPRRITIAPSVIYNAKEVIVMARVTKSVRSTPGHCNSRKISTSCPCDRRLAVPGSWIAMRKRLQTARPQQFTQHGDNPCLKHS
jgi:hypothetical protein